MAIPKAIVNGDSFIRLSLVLLVVIFLFYIDFFANPVYAQGNKMGAQVWTDTENNVRIIFNYSPANPVVNTPTDLEFSVRNLQTGDQLKNLTVGVVILTNTSGHERTFKFNNIYARNGDFSVKYQFPDLGIYQVVTRVTSNSPLAIILASFRVIVLPETSFLSNITIAAIVTVIVAGIAYFVSTKQRHLFRNKTRVSILVASISSLLSVYFFLSLNAFPHLYVTLPNLRPMPMINNVSLSSSIIHQGKSFYMSLSGTNNGDSADIQTISLGFPNLTSTDSFVQIRQSDFSQKPILIKKDEMIGSDYQGTKNLVSARYPSIEAFSRPWHSHVTHHLQLEVKPTSVGPFVIVLKSVALPHLNEFAHYPLDGLRDYQNEYVKVYSVLVVRDRS